MRPGLSRTKHQSQRLQDLQTGLWVTDDGSVCPCFWAVVASNPSVSFCGIPVSAPELAAVDLEN